MVGWVPDPDKPGWLKYDYQKYKDQIKQDALKRQEIMQEIINSRRQNLSVIPAQLQG
jgi:hypothetical protein